MGNSGALGLQPTHNLLVVGSSPTGPTTFFSCHALKTPVIIGRNAYCIFRVTVPFVWYVIARKCLILTRCDGIRCNIWCNTNFRRKGQLLHRPGHVQHAQVRIHPRGKRRVAMPHGPLCQLARVGAAWRLRPDELRRAGRLGAGARCDRHGVGRRGCRGARAA